MNVYEKLSAVQNGLKAPKQQYNSFGKYNYRSCEDIVEAAKPLLYEHKAILTLSDGIKFVQSRFYIEATATFIDTESGEKVSVTAWAREAESKKGMDESQVTGTASSYARKYALNGLFAIDDTKDPDSMDNTDQGQQKAMDSAAARQALVRCFNKNKWPIEGLLAKYGRKSMDEFTDADTRDYINILGRNGVNVWDYMKG